MARTKRLSCAETSNNIVHENVSMMHIKRSDFVNLVNGLMEGALNVGNSLKHMELVLGDPIVFQTLPKDVQVSIYKALSQRYSSTVSSINRVVDTAVKTEFNKNFFGIVSDSNEETEDNEELQPLSKEAAIVLSELTNIVIGKTK
jgi:hypothetical protein